MVIAAGGYGGQGFIVRLLGSAPLSLIGRMSYSIYLWHWPLLAFMRYLGGDDLAWPSIAAALVATAALSFLSWKYVETPFRVVKTAVDRRRAVGYACAASLAVLLLAVVIRSNNGFPNRFRRETLVTLDNLTFDKSFEYKGPHSRFHDAIGTETVGQHLLPIGKDGDLSRPDFLFWGDSHGMAVAAVIDKSAKTKGLVGCCALRPGTPPLAGVWLPNCPEGESRSRLTAGVFQAILEKRPKNVILCGKWSLYLAPKTRFGSDPWMADVGASEATPETSRQAFVAGVHRVAKACDSAGAKLWIMSEVPAQPSVSPKNRVIGAALLGQELDFKGVTRDEYQLSQELWVEILRLIPPGIATIYDLSPAFFDEKGQSIVGRDGVQWYSDKTHLNRIGAEAVLGTTIGHLMDEMTGQAATVGKETAAKERAGD